MEQFNALLTSLTATPTLDKLTAWAEDAKAVDAEQLAEYKQLLARMDWTYEFSDDGMRYRQGRDTLRQIRAMAPLVDADGALFNAARPAACGVWL
jgi:hypothetical protein